ncbi:MAG TPA: DUF481 domain-containing protein [Candidatus Omnitrophota bacterium]|nr:DUF481 domain-containing protein [Candidatus Omnitrophota bacterium]HQJ15505.1 DUF481 domain-containing protein [Candidatus Omnitrophota bacterium]
MKHMFQAVKAAMACAIAVICLSAFANEAAAEGILDGWSGDIFAGYTKTNGNTNKSTGSASAQAIKKFKHSAYQIKGNWLYSESDNKMDGQKWDILNRYTLDFGKDYRWYSFYQVLVDHDYFSDIDYRVTPSAGVGYHILTGEDFIWDVDAGAGYRITRYRVNTAKDDEAPTAVAHTFLKKKIFEKSFLSEDLTVYPGFKSDDGIVLHSETVFTNPLMDNLDFELKYILDHNTEPAGKKKTDTQIIAGLKYKF